MAVSDCSKVVGAYLDREPDLTYSGSYDGNMEEDEASPNKSLIDLTHFFQDRMGELDTLDRSLQLQLLAKMHNHFVRIKSTLATRVKCETELILVHLYAQLYNLNNSSVPHLTAFYQEKYAFAFKLYKCCYDYAYANKADVQTSFDTIIIRELKSLQNPLQRPRLVMFALLMAVTDPRDEIPYLKELEKALTSSQISREAFISGIFPDMFEMVDFKDFIYLLYANKCPFLLGCCLLSPDEGQLSIALLGAINYFKYHNELPLLTYALECPSIVHLRFGDRHENVVQYLKDSLSLDLCQHILATYPALSS